MGTREAPSRTILIVDDDPLFGLAIAEVLEGAGYTAERVESGHDALVAVAHRHPHLIVLDIGLPDIGGRELCHMLRLQAGSVPIIFLTGHRGKHDLIDGLDAGADDYLTKPCDAEELLARIRAVLRRTDSRTVGPSEIVEIGEVALNAARHEARVRGERVELSPKEFKLLWLLMSNAGRVVPRQLIVDSVWGTNFFGDAKALDVYIRLLRRKIEADPDHPSLIQTVRGVGYCFATAITPR